MFEDDAVGLLVDGLDHDRAHAGTRRGLADCLGIVAVILGPLDERLDVLRRDQANAMAQSAEQAPRMMGATASLQYHLCCILFAKEGFHLAAPELAPQYRAFLLIDAMKREHVLGRINRDALILKLPRFRGVLWDLVDDVSAATASMAAS
jgi:hypothetical protein